MLVDLNDQMCIFVTGLSQSRHERRKERMQACTIGMSIDEDIKLRSRRWRKGRLCVRQVLSEPLTRSITVVP